jgi:PilZ domain-containing protein
VSEARTGKRFPLQLPITIKHEKSSTKLKGTTSNLSAAGVYIRADAAFEVGTTVQFDITLPTEVTGTSRPVEIRCHGRVVRADGKRVPKKAGKKGGVACVIDHYKFIRK